MRKKVCILTSVHLVFDVRIFQKEAKSLVNAGYDVTLIAQHDREETIDAIKIVGLQKPRKRIERMTKTAWSAFRRALSADADIYHFHDLELMPQCLLLKALGHKVIYDVHEDVPRQNLTKDYLPVFIRKPISWMISALEWIGAKCFDGIAPATPKIALRFPAHKTVTIQNFPILDELIDTESTSYRIRPPSFAYIGGISEKRGVRQLVQALALFSGTPVVKLELAGSMIPAGIIESLKTTAGWSSVHYHGTVSRKEVSHILSGVKAGLVTLHPIINYLDSYPVKMFEYMAVGLPVIASDFPLWRRIIDGSGCGLLVDPLNPEAIAEAMRWILDHPADAEAMGRRGREAVESVYNWNVESIKLYRLYDMVLS